MKTKHINSLFQALLKNNPKPQTELKYANHFTFLIAVILSAQATDISVNKATKNLFKIIKTPTDMVSLGENRLKKYIKTIGLFNIKARNIVKLSKILIRDYNSEVPKNFDKLINLPGVGNKTASVFQNEILNLPRIAVDTHVFRVTNRIGIVKGANANLVQLKLEKIVPIKWLLKAHHLLIFHGRRVCKAQKPLCEKCTISHFCNYKKNLLNN